jgi:hypothetical protein
MPSSTIYAPEAYLTKDEKFAFLELDGNKGRIPVIGKRGSIIKTDFGDFDTKQGGTEIRGYGVIRPTFQNDPAMRDVADIIAGTFHYLYRPHAAKLKEPQLVDHIIKNPKRYFGDKVNKKDITTEPTVKDYDGKYYGRADILVPLIPSNLDKSHLVVEVHGKWDQNHDNRLEKYLKYLRFSGLETDSTYLTQALAISYDIHPKFRRRMEIENIHWMVLSPTDNRVIKVSDSYKLIKL